MSYVQLSLSLALVQSPMSRSTSAGAQESRIDLYVFPIVEADV